MSPEGGFSQGNVPENAGPLLCAAVASQAGVGPRPDTGLDPACRPCDVLRAVCEANGGVVVRAERSAVYATFRLPSGALKAALEGQLALLDALGELPSARMRMAIH